MSALEKSIDTGISEMFSEVALAYLAKHAIDPAVAAVAGVLERSGGLAFPYVDGEGAYERLRAWNGDGPRFTQPKGRRLSLWWPLGLPAPGADVLVCEGESDALAAASALDQAPLAEYRATPVCAIPGAAVAGRLGEELARLGVREAALAFDADDAGRKATERAVEALRANGIRSVDVGLPDGQDLADALAAHDTADQRGKWITGLLLDASDAARGDEESTIADSPAPPSDAGNAERLVAAHGHELRYSPELGGWIAWDGLLWRRDDDGEALRRMRLVVRAMLHNALELQDDDERKRAVQFALRSEDARRLRAAVDLAAVDAAVIAHADLLDADPMRLTCGNGTIDLRTGELHDADPRHLITLATSVPFAPDATCPRWLRFLDEVFDGDADLIEFMQRLVGYCLTGDTREHVLVVLHGGGCNGKSTLVETLRRLLGEHAATSAFDTFTRGRGDRGPRDDLARLRGARLVTAAESGEGHRLDEAVVKEITGGDTISARHLYGRFFEFRPAFKILLTTNHRPRVDGGDDAIWRRLRLVPFDQSFEGREDRDLQATLQDELPGILTWAVTGCLSWQRDGLTAPDAVRTATAAYRADEDHLGAFLAERTHTGGEVEAVELRAAYEQWCGENGERPLAGNALGRRLAHRSIRAERRRSGRGRVYIGITLAVPDAGSVNGSGNSSPPPAREGLTGSAGTIRHPALEEDQR